MLQELNEGTGTTNITWASISNGLIVIKADETDVKAKQRINKLGNTVYERFYKAIGGKIVTMTIEENKFGEKDIRVGIKNEDKDGVLTIKLESSYGRSFLAQIFNVDFTKEVSFTPWQKINDEDKKVSRLYLNYLDKTKPEWGYPTGTPEVKFVDIKGKKVVDNISQVQHIDFLEEKLLKLIKDNNLTYIAKNTNNIEEDEFFSEMKQPLTAEEKKQLKKPSASKTTKTVEEQAGIFGSDDDFFNDFK